MVAAMRLVFLPLLVALASAAARAGAEDTPPRRDAAETVKEGDVSQWLQHYQRERGEAWSRQQDPPRPQSEQEKSPAQQPASGKTDR